MTTRFFNIKRIIQTLLLSLVTLGVGVVFLHAAPTPSVISYQGFLTSATGTAQTGTTTVTIRIYDQATGGVLLFEELHPTTPITNGFFSVQIGSVGDVNGGTTATSITDLSFDRSYYVTVELASPFSTGEMTLTGGTRSQLGTVPFATISYGALQATSSSSLTAQKGRMYFNTTSNELTLYNGSSWTPVVIQGASTTLATLTVTGQTTLANASTTNLSVANSLQSSSLTVTSATSSTFFATLLNAVTAVITNLTATNATATNLVTTNSTSTNSFISSLVATLANITDLVVGNSTTTNAVITNATIANSTTTGTSVVTGTSTLATTTISSLIVGTSTASPRSQSLIYVEAPTSGKSLAVVSSTTPFFSIDWLGKTKAKIMAIGTGLYADTTTTSGGDLPTGTFTSGRYMYVSNYFGHDLQVFDVLNKDAPLNIGSVTLPGAPTGVFVSGNYAYTGNDYDSSLSVVDITNPTSPTVVSTLTIGDAPNSVQVSGNYAYIANYSPNVVIVDVSSTTAMQIATSTLTGGDSSLSVYVSGNTLYVASLNGVFSIFDITTPTDPVRLSTIRTAPAGGSFAISGNISVVGGYAYVSSYENNSVAVVDVSNPASPTIIRNVSTGQGPFSVYTSNGHLYVPNNIDGTVSVFNLSTPSNPRKVATLTAGQQPRSAQVVDGYLYVTNAADDTVSMFNVSGIADTNTTVNNLEVSNLTTRNNLFLQALTEGSVPFIGENGQVSQNNTNFFWNNTQNKLTVNNSVIGGKTFTLVATSSVNAVAEDVYVDGNYAYVANYGDGTLSVINVAGPLSPVLAGTTTVGTNPLAVFVTGGYAYVPNYDGGSGNTMSIVDVSTPSSPSVVGVATTGTAPHNVVVSGNYAYVVNAVSGSLSVIDVSTPSSPATIASLPTGADVQGIAMSGSYIFVSNYGDSTISVVDVSDPNNPVLATTTALGHQATRIQVSGNYLYTANYDSGAGNSITVVDITSPTSPVVLTSKNTKGSAPYALRIDSSKLFVANRNSNDVAVFDISSPSVPVFETKLSVLSSPSGVMASNGYLYVSTYGGGSLEIYDIGSSNTLLSSVASIKSLVVDSLKVTGLTSGAIPFISSSGHLTDGGSALFWDSARNSLAIGGNGYTDAVLTLTGNVSHSGNGILQIRQTDQSGDGTILFINSGVQSSYNDIARITSTLTGSNGGNLIFGTKYDGSTSAATERMRVTSNGNIGIGTSTPLMRLVVETDAVNEGVIISNTNTTNGASVPLFLSSMASATSTNINIENLEGSFALRTGATTLSDYGFIRMIVNTLGDFSFGGTPSLTPTSAFSFTGRAGVDAFSIASSTGDTFLSIDQFGSLTVGSSLFTVLANGNVGVGTSNPNTAFHLEATGVDVVSQIKTDVSHIAELNLDSGGFDTRLRQLAGTFYIDTELASSTFAITSTGEVGVGSTTPSAKFSIQAANGYAGALFEIASTTSAGFATSSLFIVLPNGSVGIGTSTGIAKLNINQSGNSYGLIIDNNVQPRIDLNTTQSGASNWNILNEGNVNRFSVRQTGGGPQFYIESGAAANTLIVSSSSNIGIGSTTPNFKLTVVGGGYFGGNLIATGTLAVSGQTTLSTASTTALTATTFYNTSLFGTTALLGTTTNTFDSSKLVVQGTTTLVGTAGSPTALKVIGNIDNTATSTLLPRVISTLSCCTASYNAQVVGNTFYTVTATGGAFVRVDVSNPASPVSYAAATMPAGGGTTLPLGIRVAGKYAYISGDDYFYIFDISNINSPVVVAQMAMPSSDDHYDLEISGNFVYIANADNGNLIVVDVSNPSNPRIISNSNIGSSLYDITIQGSYLYASDAVADIVRVVNISNPYSPALVSSPSGGSLGVYVSGKFIYAINSGGLSIISIQDPTSPTTVGSVFTSSSPSSVFISGRYAYVTNGGASDTVSVVDVASATAPILLGSVSVANNPESIYVSGRYAYVIGNTATLTILDLGGLESTSAIIHSLEAGNLSVRNDISTGGLLSVGTGLTVGSGGFLSQGNSAIYGSLTVGTSTYPNFLVNASNNTTNIGTSTGLASLFVQGTPTLNAFTVASSTGSSLFTIDSTGRVTFTNSSSTNASLSGNLYVTGQTTLTTASATALTATSIYGTTALLGTTTNTFDSSKLVVQGTTTLVGTAGSPTALKVIGNIDNTSATTFNPRVIASTSTESAPEEVVVSNGYAYVANRGSSSFSIFDVSSPSNPTLMATSAIGTTPRSIAVYGNYVYTISSSGGAFTVHNVANPKSPVGVQSFYVGGHLNANPWKMVVHGSYLYVVASQDAGVYTYSLTDPANPTQVSYVSTGASSRSLFAYGKYLYVTSALTNSLYVLDISNQASPRVISTLSSGLISPTSITASGRHLYVSDSAGIRVVDISDPTTPALLSSPYIPQAGKSMNVSGRYLFTVSNGKFTTVDLLNPTSPSVASEVSFGSNPYDVDISGRYAYVTDLSNNTLSVIDLGGLESTSAIIHSLEAGNLSVRNDISTGGLLSVGTALTVGQGGFYSQGNSAIYGSLQVGTSTYPNFLVNAANNTTNIGTSTGLASLFIQGTSTLNPLIVASSTGITLFSISQSGLVTLTSASTTGAATIGGQLYFASASSTGGLTLAQTLNVTGQTTLTTASATGITSTNIYGTTALLGTTTNTFDSSKLVVQGTTTLVGTTGSPTALRVMGNIDNTFSQGDWPRFITSTTTAVPGDLVVSGGFMYVISSAELSIYNVADIRNPLLISTSSANGNSIKVVGNYAYITGPSFSIVDVTDKRAPVQVGSVSYGSSYGYSVIRGQYAYVSSSVENTLKVIDISNPLEPSVVASLSIGSSPRDLAISDNVLYLVEHGAGGNLFSIDISNPLNPVLLDTLSVASGLQSVKVSGGYVYVQRFSSGGLYIVDGSNPSDLVQIASVSTGSGSNDIKIDGGYAYVPNYNAHTISIVDVRNPYSPVLVKNISTSNNPSALFVDGKNLYVTNYGLGGVVSFYELPGLESVSALIHSLETGNLSVRNSLTTSGLLSVGAGLTVGSGGFLSQGNSAVYGSLQVGTSTYPNFLVNASNNTTNIGTSTGLATLFVQGTSTLNPFSVASSTGTSLFTVLADGSVGVGTTSMSGSSKFFVEGSINISQNFALRANDNWLIGQSSTTNTISIGSTVVANDIQFNSSAGTDLFTIKSDGNVGVGSTTPFAKLSIGAFAGTGIALTPTDTATVLSSFNDSATGDPEQLRISHNFARVNIDNLRSSLNLQSYGGDVIIGTTSVPGSRLDIYHNTPATSTDMFRVISDVGTVGNVIYTIKANGDIFTDGNTTIGTPADLAENYPTSDTTITPGMVVALSSTTLSWSQSLPNGSTTDYEIAEVKKAEIGEQALGVISTRPGILLGGNTEKGIPVAFSGRVPVYVSNENGVVRRGDSLTVSSSTPGYAMKQTTNGQSIGRAVSDQDTTSTSSLVMMIVEQKERTITLSPTEGLALLSSSSTPPTTTVRETLLARLSQGFSIVREYVAVSMSAVTGYFDTVFAREVYTDSVDTKVICLGEEGNKTCVTKEKLDSLLLLDPNNIESNGGQTEEGTSGDTNGLTGDLGGGEMVNGTTTNGGSENGTTTDLAGSSSDTNTESGTPDQNQTPEGGTTDTPPEIAP